MANSRGTWQMNPVTRIKESERRKNNRKKVKERIRNGDYEDS